MTDLGDIPDMFAAFVVTYLPRDGYRVFTRKGAVAPEDRRAREPAADRLARWAEAAARARAAENARARVPQGVSEGRMQIAVSGSAGRMLAAKMGKQWTHGQTAIAVDRSELAGVFRMEAEHDAGEARRFGGNATESWLSSNSELIARGLSWDDRREFSRLYLDHFRQMLRA